MLRILATLQKCSTTNSILISSPLQAYRELQKKFISDRKREEAASGEFGLYYQQESDFYEPISAGIFGQT
jgi:hypothetical protein